MKEVVVHSLELLDGISRRGPDDIVGLRDTDWNELDASIPFNVLDHHLVLLGPECNASSRLAGSGRSTRSMNVGLSVLWRLNLNNKVNVWNVEASRSYISCNQHTKFVLFESLKSNFSLILGNITMHDLNVILDFV